MEEVEEAEEVEGPILVAVEEEEELIRGVEANLHNPVKVVNNNAKAQLIPISTQPLVSQT
jgi:hypothetical protein